MTQCHKTAAKFLGVGAGLAAAAYGVYVSRTWIRYGRPSRPSPDDQDEALDRFMPQYDVVERHRVGVRATADVTFAAAKDMDLSPTPAIAAIFKARELILGATPDERSTPRGIVEQTKTLGWVVLREIADREIIMGAVTKPWEANVVFRSIPSEAFASFSEPGYVKIVWTLRADPVGDGQSIFRTETRAVATDLDAKRRFRRYWAFLSPGIILIRWLSLGPLKREAERRFQQPQAVRPSESPWASAAP
jgi:hypothetical protein